MSRILITGGSSFLGRHLVPQAAVSHTITHTYFRHNPITLPPGCQLDICDETAVRSLIFNFQPEIIVHLAGSNRGPQMATVIRQGAGNVTWAAREVGARLIHLSTDVIFRGDAAPYAEDAQPTPVNEYGRAKADAEAIVQQHANSVIVRTSLIYSLTVMDHGTRWMAEALAQGEKVTLFSNQIRNPVWTGNLCAALLELAENDFTGILNVAGGQALTRAKFALKMLDYWQVYPRTTLSVAPSTESWPLNCELDLSRAAAVLQTPLSGVDVIIPPSAAKRQDDSTNDLLSPS